MISQKIRDLQKDLKALRPLQETAESGSLEVEGASDHPADIMGIKLGKWTTTPFPHVTIFGVSISENEVTVVCQVKKALRFKKHTHGPWAERLVLDKGSIYEHSNGRTYSEGAIYYQPAGVYHEPEFLSPGRCMITWTKQTE